jgi:formylglycine-generating enzyme required for sulfatase activity/serine/threonine protein kinase
MSAPEESNDPLGLVGQVIAEKYEIDRFVAEGGFSVLYRAQHRIWKAPVALKFLKVLAGAAPGTRDQLLQSFVQEGALLRELSSRTASILQAHDVGTLTTSASEWYPYLVLEWLEGLPLDAVLADEKARGVPPWTLPAVMHLLEPAARALDVVHRRGVAHRDIKPANLFVIGTPRADDAFVKVLDFGIAKVVSDMAELSAAKAQTGMGLTSFTPWYGAPEQFSRKYGATGPWTDVFALGLVLVEMLTGKSPLVGDEVPELALSCTNPMERPTPRFHGADVSDAVEAVFLKAFSIKTTDRYATAGEFWNALREATGAQPVNSAPVSLALPSYAGTAPTSLAGAAPTVLAGTAPPSSVSGGKGGKLGAVLGGVAVLALVAGGAFVALKKDPPPVAPPPAAVVASTPAAAPSAPAPACLPGMVAIPGGNFYMGLDSEIATPFEKPQHQVTLKPFCVDVTEVTVEAYRACSAEGKCPPAPTAVTWPGIKASEKKTYGPLCNIDDPGRDKHPINCIDWDMADNFCKKTGKRLPSSAEWEFAVRGPDGRVYPWGDEKPDANHLNACGTECVKWGREHGETLAPMHGEDDGFPTTAPVGSFPKGRSRYGLDDVIGNVMEWVQDWDGPYTKEAQTNPTGPATGTERVIRGGAWNAGDTVWVRPSFRFKFSADVRSHGIGFRCAKDQG